MTVQWTRDDLIAALAWQLEMGVDEAIDELPVDRYALEEPSRAPAAKAQVASVQAQEKVQPEAVNFADQAQALAAQVQSIEDLREAVRSFEGFAIKQGARNLVWSDGNPQSRVMLIGEGPGRDEDVAGRPFVGRAGQLLDKMFGAIGLSRQSPDPLAGLYITNVVHWRPPANRTPTKDEVEMARPILLRHIELANPDVLVVMGNAATSALLHKIGILRLRGNWAEAAGRPVMPMAHPAYLLRTPEAKRDAWADLLKLQAFLKETSQ